jgi:hypothetical protein
MNKQLKNFWQQGVIYKANHGLYNTTVHWSGTDTRENYLKNPKLGYTETSISYDYNEYGFRCDQFDLTDQRPRILCMGCSHTEGTGLPVSQIWPTLLQEKFSDYKLYNLGVGGASCDTVARVLTNVCSVLTPAKVFILWPEIDRFEIFENPQSVIFKGTWNVKSNELFLLDELHSFNRFERNKLIVELLRENFKFDLYTVAVNELSDQFYNLSKIDQARDNHYGPTQHKHIAKLFMDLVDL